jgi:hypothetical protein
VRRGARARAIYLSGPHGRESVQVRVDRREVVVARELGDRLQGISAVSNCLFDRRPYERHSGLLAFSGTIMVRLGPLAVGS